VATRFQADRDLVIVPESQGSKLDPSTRDGVGAKMGLDATKPLDADEMKFKRIRVPGEEDVDLASSSCRARGGARRSGSPSSRHEWSPPRGAVAPQADAWLDPWP
jgi:2,5-furandicarboxylate decarboxylase 1